MKDSFNKLFWGFLLILLEIHIFVVDILPDPIGYFFILTGLNLLVDKYPIGKKARILAIGLILFSIPTVFIKQNINLNQMGMPTYLTNVWPIYTTILEMLKLILVFYVFQTMTAIARSHGDHTLMERTSKIFTTYISIMLIIIIMQPFAMNLYGDELTGFTIILSITGLVTEIVFLVLLRKFRSFKDFSL